VNRLRRLRQRLARTVATNRRDQLLADSDRADQYLGMILHAARALSAPETIDCATSRLFLQMWKIKVADWARESDS
jgi:hypothetical protein